MSSTDLDSEVLVRLKRGDEHAFADLFSVHRDQLKRMVQFRMDRRLSGREDASDILQEVYLDAHQRMPHYLRKPGRSFYVWLRQLTQQRLIDIHRRHLKAGVRDVRQEVRSQGRRPDATSISIARHLVARMVSPSQVAMRDEAMAAVEKGLGELDELDREVLALRHFEELRNSEVAEVLGISKAAASNRYVRALTRLREILQEINGFFDAL